MDNKTKRGTRLSTEEKKEIAMLRAQGGSYHSIGKAINRSEHTVKKALGDPEVKEDVRTNQARLADKYAALAERIADAVTDDDIKKASLQQMATASGIFIDKSRLLSGQSTENTGVLVKLVIAACESDQLPPCPVVDVSENIPHVETDKEQAEQS